MNEKLKIFLPSSGSLYKGSLDYFEKSELIITKESDRKLVGKIKGSDSIEIYFQRSGDIPVIIDRGVGHIGVTGLDRYLEHCENSKLSKISIQIKTKFHFSPVILQNDNLSLLLFLLAPIFH